MRGLDAIRKAMDATVQEVIRDALGTWGTLDISTFRP
jgi:hypothetical protein